MIQKIDGGVFYNYFIAFGDFVIFFSRDIGLNSITLENINLSNGHCDYCDLETINHVKQMTLHNKYKQRKTSKNR